MASMRKINFKQKVKDDLIYYLVLNRVIIKLTTSILFNLKLIRIK